MPLKRCKLDGKDGWKWGDEGKCYADSTDKENKKEALKQAMAIAISKGTDISDYLASESYTEEEQKFTPPKESQENAKKALEWREKYSDEVEGGTRVGWTRANQLASGQKISLDIVKRMAQFNRHRKNSKVASEYKDTPWKDRGYIAWLIWGGDAGIDWAIETLKDLENKKEEKMTNSNIRAIAENLFNIFQEKAISSFERDRMSSFEYAIPERNKYPINDEKHARIALGSVEANGTEQEKQRVRNAVFKKFPDLRDEKEGKENKKEGRFQFYVTGKIGNNKLEVIVSGEKFTYVLPEDSNFLDEEKKIRAMALLYPQDAFDYLQSIAVDYYKGDYHYNKPLEK